MTLTADRAAALDADGLVVPGVGAFAACMEGLRAVRGHEIIGRRLAGGRPVLGICVGMQILFERGVEHGVATDGCDEWPGVVERLQAPVVPHMGWNTVEVPEGTTLFAGVEDERFYFVHSYGVRDWTLVTNGRTRPPLVTWAEHGGDRFVAAVENGPLTATQFHPEKSGDAGARLLRNWVDGLPDAPLLARRARPPGPREQGARPAPRGARAGGRGRRGRPRRPGRAPRPAARPPAGAGLAAAPTSPATARACWPSVGAGRPPRRSRCCSALNLLVWVLVPDWPAAGDGADRQPARRPRAAHDAVPALSPLGPARPGVPAPPPERLPA